MDTQSAALHRTLAAVPPLAVQGEGCYLIDAEGRRYLDASGGAAVSSLGHSHPAVVDAIRRQVGTLAYAHTSFFTSGPAEQLAAKLIALAPRSFGAGRVAFVGSGSEAMEVALKLARQYHVERGEPTRAHFIARRMSYHGNTLGALAVGGHPARRAMYAPMLFGASHIEPCHPYRFKRADEDDRAYGLRSADELDAEIRRIGPSRVAAFVAEPVVGATLGCVAAVPGYFERIAEVCRAHGVLFIADEVMCGMGRCGTMFAIEHDAVTPDIITLGKGLGAGYVPIGATMASGEVAAALERGSGALANGHTYMGHPLACAASLAVVQALESEALLDNVRLQGARLHAALVARFGDHPHVGDIRGRGLFFALELVADRIGKQPFPSECRLAVAVKRLALERGLVCYPSGGTADGKRGDHVLLAPPYILRDHQVDEIVDRLAAALDAALEEVPCATLVS